MGTTYVTSICSLSLIRNLHVTLFYKDRHSASVSPPPPLNKQVLAIPQAAQQVLLKALAKDPHQRFARIQDFADALEQAYQSKGPPLIDMLLRYNLHKPIERNSLLA